MEASRPSICAKWLSEGGWVLQAHIAVPDPTDDMGPEVGAATPEAELLARAHAGNTSAFESLVKPQRHRARSLLSHAGLSARRR